MTGAIDEAAVVLGEDRISGDLLRSRVNAFGGHLTSTFCGLTDDVVARLLA